MKCSTILLVLVFGFIGLKNKSCYAQQDILNSHYVDNELLFNPAYAGSKNNLYLQGLFRTQWVSFPGAPKTVTFGIHSPIKESNMAIGGSLFADKLGPQNRIGMSLIYAYHIPLSPKLRLSIGVQGTFAYSRIDLNELDIYNNGTSDIAINELKEKQITPNFGAGVYLYSNNFSIGIGIPHLVSGQVLNSEKMKLEVINHYFITAAYLANISEAFKIQPTLAAKVVKGSPFQMEGNLNLIFANSFLIGAGYRSDNSAIFRAQYMMAKDSGIKNVLKIGYAYDLSWKDLRQATTGSHEVFIGLGIVNKRQVEYSPRYF